MIENNTGPDEARDKSAVTDDQFSEEWCDAKPAIIPEPTPWPMVLALAATIAAWGILTSWVFVVVGLLLSALSLFQWIEEMRK